MDLFALRNGFAFDSNERLRCGFLDLLREHYRQGHCAFPEDQVLQQASDKLGVPRSLIESILELELVEEGIVAETVDGVPCLYLKQIWDLERHVAAELLRFEGKEPPWGWFNLEKSLAWAQSQGARIGPESGAFGRDQGGGSCRTGGPASPRGATEPQAPTGAP